MNSSTMSSDFSSSSSSGKLTNGIVSGIAKPVKLCTSKKEKEHFDHLANLYGIIRAVEGLEKAFSSPNAISSTDYRRECAKLIDQFHTTQQFAELETPEQIKQFMSQYNLQCKMAYKRLVELGTPGSTSTGATTKIVAEIVQHFITLVDTLRLDMTAVDDIQPLLSELVDSLSSSLILFEGKEKIMNWFQMINRMKATEELTPEQKRQMIHDLETSYNSFHKSLKS